MVNYIDYIKQERLPHTWCAGCGYGIILQSIAATLGEMEMDKHDLAFVSGVGCFGRIDDYLDMNCFHVSHGRALAAATGVALANPNLTVLVGMGDGDGVTIGGNHLIHAARRNVNVTAILANNYNYGQTGGQYSGTTPTGSITATSPYGHIEENFDICQLAIAAGATYVARGIVYNPVQLRKLIRGGIEHKGFSLIEVMSPCPTHYGKFNKQGDAARMMKAMSDSVIPAEKAVSLSPDELKDHIVTGLLHEDFRSDYFTDYQEIINKYCIVKEV